MRLTSFFQRCRHGTNVSPWSCASLVHAGVRRGSSQSKHVNQTGKPRAKQISGPLSLVDTMFRGDSRRLAKDAQIPILISNSNKKANDVNLAPAQGGLIWLYSSSSSLSSCLPGISPLYQNITASSHSLTFWPSTFICHHAYAGLRLPRRRHYSSCRREPGIGLSQTNHHCYHHNPYYPCRKTHNCD